MEKPRFVPALYSLYPDHAAFVFADGFMSDHILWHAIVSRPGIEENISGTIDRLHAVALDLNGHDAMR